MEIANSNFGGPQYSSLTAEEEAAKAAKQQKILDDILKAAKGVKDLADIIKPKPTTAPPMPGPQNGGINPNGGLGNTTPAKPFFKTGSGIAVIVIGSIALIGGVILVVKKLKK